MSKEDVKKGIAIQAKADAEKIEKLAKGLNAHRTVLTSLETGQTEIRDAMGIVLDDMSAGEAKFLYDLQVKKTPDELDHTEKRVLCACIYTLLSSFGQNTPNQMEFYTNLEKYLGVSERKSDFDFYTLNNVDSHTDRLVILKTICSFLFLNQESFSFLREKETFSWLFAFAPVKDVSDVCSAINAEYAVLGTTGILGNYDPLLAPLKTMEDNFYALTAGEDESLDEAEEEPEEKYKELSDIIVGFLADEAAFGKGIAFSEKDLKKELPSKLSDIAFDALVAVSKIEKGHLIFTTHALYLKAGGFFSNEYIGLPYRSIQTNKMTTAEGRQAGTRKLIIPVMFDQSVKTISIDDTKLQEEKLRDLLIKIAESECIIAETDRITSLNQLDQKTKGILLSVIVYLFKEENLPLIDLFLMAKDWGLDEDWNTLASACESDKDYDLSVKMFIQSIPYPSARVTSLEAMSLIMALVTRANKLAGKESSSLSTKMENGLQCFVVGEIEKKQFNLMVKQSVGVIKDRPLEEYIALQDELSHDNILFKEAICPTLESLIEKIKSGIDYKAKTAVKKTAKDVSHVANAVHDKVKDNLSEMARRGKKVKKKEVTPPDEEENTGSDNDK